jgi:hypothetical protein
MDHRPAPPACLRSINQSDIAAAQACRIDSACTLACGPCGRQEGSRLRLR